MAAPGRPRPAGHAVSIPRTEMLDSASITRVLFEDFRPWAVRVFYVLGYSAIAVFLYGVYVEIRKYRRGAKASLEGGLWGRFLWMVESLFTQRTVARRDRPAGGKESAAHGQPSSRSRA